MAAITNDWLGPLSSEFKKPYYKELYKTVKHEYETKRVFPEPDDIFQRICIYTAGRREGGDSGAGPLPQLWSGPWPVFFSKAGCGYSALTGEYLPGASRRFGVLYTE